MGSRSSALQTARSRSSGAAVPPVWLPFALGLLLLIQGCATAPRPEPLDLNSGDWRVRQAQALWRPDSGMPELAGDLLLASRADGAAFVQFSKTLPLASARVWDHHWEIEFPPEQRRYSGRGLGPSRVVWLQLIHVINGEPAAAPWVAARSEDLLTLKNPHSGETLEVHFF